MSEPTQALPHSMRPGGTFSLADRVVARVGYGAMQLPRISDPDVARGVVQRAYASGVNHFDTAHFYGEGVANGYLAEVLADKGDAMIVTKIGASANPGGNIPLKAAQRPEQLRQEVHHNLRSLKTEHLGMVYLRRITPGSFPMTAEQEVDFDDQMAEMIDLRNEGLIDAIGLSTVSLAELQQALPAGIAAVQNPHNVLSPDDQAVRDLCITEAMGWVPYFPLGGNLGGPKVTEDPTVQAIARELGVSPAQVGLAWVLRSCPNGLIIPGTTSVAHLEQNIAAGSLELDAATMARLNAIAA